MYLSDIPTIFFTLFFVVDPLGLVPVFIAYLSGYERRERTRVILKSTAISIAVSVAFIVFGRHLLVFLGITTGSFLVAGGILLFLISIEMLFGMPSRVKMRNRCEEDAVTSPHGDISVFPLAIPMLCGPGNIAALLMFGSQAWGSPLRMAVIALLSTAVFLIAMAVMFASRRLESIMGETGISITQRLIGLILSAMSVQFIKNGLVEMGVLS